MSMEKEEEKMLSVKQVSKMLNISLSSTYRLLDRKELPSYKVGNLVRIKQSDIEAYLERNKQ